MNEPPRLHFFYGDEVRRARKAKELTQRQLGDHVYCEHTLISMIETGQRLGSPDTSKLIDDVLEQDGRLHRLWAEARAADAPSAIAALVEYESKASAIREYHPVLVPGLLQTEGYMRALYEGGLAVTHLTADEVDTHVAARLKRQEIINGPRPVRYIAILDEIVISRTIGTSDVMCEQLKALMTAVRRPATTIQVSAPDARPAVGPIKIIETADVTAVHLESVLRVGQTVTDGPTVGEVEGRFDLLRAQALPQTDSMRLIQARIEELEA